MERRANTEVSEGRKGMIYFIWAKGTPFVKVGRTAGCDKTSAQQRLQCLSAGCPHELELIYTFSLGSQHDDCQGEKQLHLGLTLIGRHVRGEWFRLPKTRRYLRKVVESCLDKTLWREQRTVRRYNQQATITISAKALRTAGIGPRCKRLDLTASEGILRITRHPGRRALKGGG